MPGPGAWLTDLVAVAVVAGWLAAIASSAVRDDWRAAEIVTPVMLILAGYAFGLRIVRREPGDDD